MIWIAVGVAGVAALVGLGWVVAKVLFTDWDEDPNFTSTDEKDRDR